MIVFLKIQHFFNKKLGVILFLFYFISIYKITSYPVYIDEATSYNDYVSKGFWGAISSYKEPNNHVFYSLLLVIFSKLPIDVLIAMRIVNVILGLSSIYLMYKSLSKKYTKEIVYICLYFFAFSYFFLFYSIFARGYMLLILCTVSLFSILDKLKDTHQFHKKQFVFFSVISCIGFCTIPIFLYIYASFCFIIFVRFLSKVYDKTLLTPFLISAMFTVFSVILFYLPILMHDGIDSIVNNKWTKTVTYADVINYVSIGWKGFYDKIFGVRTFWVVIGLILMGIYFYFKKRESRLLLFEYFSFIFLPFVFLFLHKVIPGTRTWSYLLVPFTFLIAFFVNELFTTNYFIKFKKWYFLLCILLLSVQVTIFNKTHPLAGLQNDYYYGNVALFLVDKHPTSIFFENGKSAYESVLYTFYKTTNTKFSAKTKTNEKLNLIVGYLNRIRTDNQVQLIYSDKNINLGVFKLQK